MLASTDCELDDADLEDGGDDEPDDDGEPSLGWPENMAQGNGLWGGSDDREAS